MGKLVLFKRKIDFSDDDVYIFTSLSSFFHFSMLCVSLITYMSIGETCIVTPSFALYLQFHIILLLVVIPLELLLTFLSMCGTVANQGVRRYTSHFFHVYMITSTLEILVQCFGIHEFYGPDPLSNTLVCLSWQRLITINVLNAFIIWSLIASLRWFLVDENKALE